MALIDVPCDRPEVAAGLVGHDIEVSLGLAQTAYRGVLIATLPHQNRVLIEVPDALVRLVEAVGWGSDARG